MCNEFCAKELGRISKVLTTLDPSTHEYHICLQSIECFTGIVPTLQEAEIAFQSVNKVVDDSFPATVESNNDKPMPTPTPAPTPTPTEPYDIPDDPKPVKEDPTPASVEAAVEKVAEAVEAEEPTPTQSQTYTAVEVRVALAELRKRGGNVAEVLKKFGASGFGALDSKVYPEVMEYIMTISEVA